MQKEVEVHGRKIEVYDLSELVKRVNEAMPDNQRTSQTFRKWTLKGVMPPPLFRLHNRNFYTASEIDAVVAVLKAINPRQGEQHVQDKIKDAMGIALKTVRDELYGRKERN